MRKKMMMFFAYILIGVGVTIAQTQKITGVVSSEDDGLPIIGASVLVQGTSMGTITDIDGNFTLMNAPASAKHIEVSYIGMKSVVLPIKPSMRIVLQSDTKALDEVMVVAYGTAKKSSFTGAAATVQGDELTKMQVSSVSKALEGAAPGVQVINTSGQPGSNAKIRIRGIGSFSASSAPLYVVDGMPYDESAVNAINPNDIESLSILKDAASAALYGSRAANGVIMITTKKGKAGSSSVDVEARWGINQRAVPEYNIMKDPRQFVLSTWNVLKNKPKGTAESASEDLINSLGYNPFIGVPNDQMVTPNGQVSNAPLIHSDNWSDAVMHTGLRQEYNVSFQGGSEKTKQFLSFGYLSDEGILKGTDFQRFSGRANITHEVNKHFGVDGSLSYARGEINAGQSQGASLSNFSNAFFFTQSVSPIYPVYAYDREGNKLHDENGVIYDFGDGEYSTRLGSFSNQNPAAISGLDVHETLNDNFSGRGSMYVNFLNDFKLSANMGYDLMVQGRTDHMNPLYGDAAKVGGRTYKTNNRTETITFNQILNYNKSFDLHSVDVMLGHEAYSFKYRYEYAHKYNFYVVGNPEFNNAITMSDMSSFTQKHTMDSYFGRVNYDYNNTYYFSGSIRSDKSSKFHPSRRQGTFWSLGASWRMTQEEFLQDVEWLSDLKLRASYGTQGNDGILDTSGNVVYQPYLQQYSVSNNSGDFSLVETYRGNERLTWETSKNFNLGIEGGFFNNRLKVELDYFFKKTSDMLYNMPYPISSGISYVPMNLLDMQNTGVEFNISATPIMTEDFTWTLSLNGTHYKNEILRLPENKREKGIIHGTGSMFRLMEGKSIYDLYMKDYAGVDSDTGVALWYMDSVDENGKKIKTVTSDYESATDYDKGSVLPDFQGAINTTLSYKGFDFSVSTNYQIGGKVYDSMYASFMHAGDRQGSNWHKDILNSWTPENSKTNVPILNASQTANSQSTRFLTNASFFNLRNITFGYTFPTKWVRAITANSARVYLSADNVALASKRKGMDPRQYVYGYSAANYSAIRTISVGLKLNF